MLQRLLQILLIIGLLSSCEQKEQACVPTQTTETTLPAPTTKITPQPQLSEVNFEALPGWKTDDMQSAYRAFGLNCEAIAKAGGENLGKSAIKISTPQMKKICTRFNPVKAADFKQFVQKEFRPWLVTMEGSNSKFTSYFESKVKASYTKNDKYHFPIYGLPLDLIEFNPHDFDPAMASKKLFGRVLGQKLVPYYTRSEILDDVNYANKAPVILWADSYVDVYVMQIQGSAIAELDNGSKVRVGFAGTNGRPFKGIGSILLDKKLIKPGQASMGKIKQWLVDNYAKAYPHMNENQRFVFHRLIENDGPIGALGVPLTPGRSLAVDRNYIPLGAVLWLDTQDGSHEKIQKLVLAQDIGGAIVGAIRGDYFWGSGGDEILEHAGKMNSAGSYYVLLPREETPNHD